METRRPSRRGRSSAWGAGLQHSPDAVIDCVIRQLSELIEVDRKYASQFLPSRYQLFSRTVAATAQQSHKHLSNKSLALCRALPQSIPPHWTNSQRKAMLRRIDAIYAPRSNFRLCCKQWREAHDHRVVSIGRLLWKVPSARPRPGLFSNVTSVDMSGAFGEQECWEVSAFSVPVRHLRSACWSRPS
jgi:hypothetical protein